MTNYIQWCFQLLQTLIFLPSHFRGWVDWIDNGEGNSSSERHFSKR